MRKHISIALMLLLLPVFSFGWTITLSPTTGYTLYNWSIDATSDGGVIVAGLERTAFDTLVVTRLDAGGNLMWQWRTDQTTDDYIPQVAAYPSGDLQLCYTAFSIPGSPVSLIRFSHPDSIIWERTFSEDDPMPVYLPIGMKITDAGNLYLTGIRVSAAGTDVWGRVCVARLNETGDFVWQTECGEGFNPDDTIAMGTNITQWGNSILTTGVYYPIRSDDSTSFRLFAALIDTDGTVLWEWEDIEYHTFAGSEIIPFTFCAPSGDRAMVGASMILTDRVVSYLTILDDDGTPSFIRMLDSRIDDGIPFALSAAENGFFASGAKYFGTGVDTFAAWTAKLSTTDGEPIWENTYLRGTTFTDMVSFPDEGFAACGIYWVNGWVIRADDDGDTTFS
ncbi:hypothetical protein DRQ26_03130, partial [bacterium]